MWKFGVEPLPSPVTCPPTGRFSQFSGTETARERIGMTEAGGTRREESMVMVHDYNVSRDIYSGGTESNSENQRCRASVTG